MILEYCDRLSQSNVDSAIYTIEDKDTDKKSLKKLYLELGDPTEYLFASMYFDSYSNWKQMLSKIGNKLSPVPLEDVVEVWRVELAEKLKAEAIRSIIVLSKKENGLTAAKWIASGSLDSIVRPSSTSKRKKAKTPRDKSGDLEMLKALEI